MIHAVALSDLPKVERPHCPECGHTAMSNGKNWLCGECGHSWVKTLRQPPVDFSTRPHCPRCDSQHTIKWGGLRKKCCDCDKTFKVAA
jgi:transposase-like protein